MRKYTLAICFTFVFCSGVCAQPCENLDVSITSQAEVDNFAATYPGCTVFSNINIYNTNVTNLNGLSHVVNVGRISLTNNPLLKDFTGMSSLKKVLVLQVTENGAKSLEGLTSLDSINFTLYIRTPLLDFKGLESVKWINKIFMQGNYPNPYAVDATFAGLDSLEGIGTMELNTPSLLSFNGLENVKTIATISMLNMWKLSSIEGIANAEITNGVAIDGAFALNNCGVKSICEMIASDKPTQLRNNLPGCASNAAILASPGCLVTFPVELISFNGMSSAEGNRLTWETNWEAGNKGFSVERSANAFAFKEIGFVRGAIDSNVKKAYSFNDHETNGPAYYRLKQLDWDGTFTYSRIISVGPAGRMTKVYPNPAKGHIYVEQKNPGQGYRLTNRYGFTVMESAVLRASRLDVSALPSDFYILRVGDETFKVMVNNN